MVVRSKWLRRFGAGLMALAVAALLLANAVHRPPALLTLGAHHQHQAKSDQSEPRDHGNMGCHVCRLAGGLDVPPPAGQAAAAAAALSPVFLAIPDVARRNSRPSDKAHRPRAPPRA